MSLAFNAGAVLPSADPGFRRAAGAAVVRALNGEFGTPGGAGLVQLLRATATCCGPEAAPAIAPYLVHALPLVRLTAAWALGFVPGPGTESDLRAAWWRTEDDETRTAIERAMLRARLAVAAERSR